MREEPKEQEREKERKGEREREREKEREREWEFFYVCRMESNVDRLPPSHSLVPLETACALKFGGGSVVCVRRVTHWIESCHVCE